MHRILDGVILSVIGQVNRLVFGLSRGQIVIYRFRGVPAILLTVTTPAEPVGKTVSVACLPLDEGYLVLSPPLQWAEVCALLDSSTAVEAARGPDETTVRARLDGPIDPAERPALLERVLSQANMDERAEARRLELAPIARLTLHQPFPETDHFTYAVATVTDDAEPSSGPR